MERPWLKRYPAGVPADLPPLPFATLPDMIEQCGRKFTGKVAFDSLGAQLTFDEVLRKSEAFAAYLQKGLGLKKGDRVAVMMPNMLAYSVALFGILRAGMVAVSVNPLYTAREVENQMKDSGAVAIVIFEGSLHALEEVIGRTSIKHVIRTAIGDLMPALKGMIINLVIRKVKKLVKPYTMKATPISEALAKGAGQAMEKPKLASGDFAFLQYTGGTTGVSKGAALSHANVLSNVEQTRLAGLTLFKEGEEVGITALPMYHIAALVLNCFFVYRLGGKQILIANPRDIAGFIKIIAKSRFTFILGVNTLYNALVNHPNIGTVDFSRLKLSSGGAAAIQEVVAKRWQQISGKVLVEGYGLTETSGAATICPHDLPAFSATVGIPVPGCDIQIRDDSGKPLPLGQAGQIYIKGPNVMTGYWQKPEETAKVLGADGFLATGDVGVLSEDGMLKIVDRVKDMIIVSGFNVYPNEVEDVLAKCPGVLEAAAIGVPSSESGEAVKVFVVKKDPALTQEQVKSFCREQLTGYKMPREIEFIAALPKSPVGKVLRRELRDAAKKKAA
ncbi:MAG: long-chain-fatty-acid--CoA ligase [Betaproteobacteria bacterium]|nr:long-chain-fatty-acid--CoA ligase [Betaproteobacteria bacterium]